MPIRHSLYRESGQVTIDPGTCTNCGQCARICPSQTITVTSGTVGVRSDSPFGCIACGHCMMVCAEAAVSVRGRGISPEDVLPLPDPQGRAGVAELGSLMQSRRSVRHFTAREVEVEQVERIVALAATAPMGIPPWDVSCVVVHGRQEVQRIAAEAIGGYEAFLKLFRPWALALMRPFLGQAKYDMLAHFVRPLAETYVKGRREGRDLLFYDAPALLIFSHSAYADAADAVIACTYAMLAAESMGLGSTVIGGAAPILRRNRAWCRTLGVPPEHTPSICLVFGYPDVHFRRALRREFSQVVTVSGKGTNDRGLTGERQPRILHTSLPCRSGRGGTDSIARACPERYRGSS